LTFGWSNPAQFGVCAALSPMEKLHLLWRRTPVGHSVSWSVMKAAHLAGFTSSLTFENLPPVKSGDGKPRAAAPRVLIEFELARNLMAGSNIGSGEVLVYGANNEQAEMDGREPQHGVRE
jgi:hypothetical protein